jgi:hypothetical protein
MIRVIITQTERERERERERQTERERDRERETETERERQRERDRDREGRERFIVEMNKCQIIGNRDRQNGERGYGEPPTINLKTIVPEEVNSDKIIK